MEGGLTSENVMQLDAVGLTDAVKSSYDMDNDVDRAQIQAVILLRADQIKARTVVQAMIKQCEKSMGKMEAELEQQTEKKLAVTISNFLKIMRDSEQYDGIRYNVLRNCAEIHKNGTIERWSDADESASKEFIESRFGIFSESKHTDALRMLFREREYNPIQDIIDGIEWDGINRCEHFLTTWAKAEDSQYTREVSRLIFAGGINRLYNPGCKFDDMAVLIGTKQGEGKSTLVRWLAVNDQYFTDNITEMDGQRSIEQLQGAWICEVAELLALTKQKDQEAAKSYITRQVDSYRRPYDRNQVDLPRRCIFVGTTNNRQFLRDKTGNRRYYPVVVHSNGYWLYEHEQECRDYILQCWAEARERLKAGDMPHYANKELAEVFKAEQDNATEDDWRVGVIGEYLDTIKPGGYVCVKQIVDEALYGGESAKVLSPKEAHEIAIIVGKHEDFEIVGRVRLPIYGQQRCWRRRSNLSETEIPF